MNSEGTGEKLPSASVSTAEGLSLGGGGNGVLADGAFHFAEIQGKTAKENERIQTGAVDALIRVLATVLKRGEARR